MKACGLSVPKKFWPNWPMNPGPQPGEPGYDPKPFWKKEDVEGKTPPPPKPATSPAPGVQP